MRLETDKKIIGQIIKEYRKKKKYTQSKLAEQVGLNEKQISRIEAGQNYPTYTSFAKIMNTLDIEIEAITKDSKTRNSPIQNEIIKLIKNSNEKELKLYIDVINSLKNNLNSDGTL